MLAHPALEAEERLQKWRDGEIRLHPNTVYALALEATGDEEQAQKCFSAAVSAGLRTTP